MKSDLIRSGDLNGHTLAATARAEAQRYEHLRARLIAEVPDIDADTLADTLEGITDLHEALAEVVRSALDDEAVATGLAARLGDMKQRLDRLETRGKRKRQLVLQILKDAGIDKLNAPDFTAGLRQSGPALEILSEADIPEPFWKPQPPKLDKLSLLAALKTGNSISGAALAAPQVQLTVRTK